MRYATMTEARKALADSTLVWHNHGAFWVSEKGGQAVGAHRCRDVLIYEYLNLGETVYVLRRHQGGTVSATQARRECRPCIEGCGRLADMPRNPVWCAECNAERIDRITRSFEPLAAGFRVKVDNAEAP